MTNEVTPIKRGRKPYLSENGKLKLRKIIHDDSLSLQSKTAGAGGTFEQTVIDIAQSENPNFLAEVRISPETQRRLKKELGFKDELATPKTSGRINAFNNMRTHLSLCSLMYYLQNSVTRCNYHSVDDVSVLLNSMGGKPEVVTTSEAKQELQQCNLSVSTMESSQKQSNYV